jgi:hypothetical protein
MSADNVTPIRSGEPPREPPAPRSTKPRRRAQVKGLLLAESDEFEGFCTYDVLTGLNGVCHALDKLEYTVNMDIDLVSELARAAMVLSTILRNRQGDA